MKTKLLSLLLAASLIAGLLPVMTAGAETTATGAPSSVPTTAATSVPTTAATTTTTQATAPTTTPTTTPTGATDPTGSGVSISLKLCETGTAQGYLAELTVTKGGAPVYATTRDSGVPTLVTNGSVPSNNYVKFEYPQNGLPTITLMNVKLRSAGNVLDLSSFDIAVNIVVAGNSSIESTGKCGIYRASYGDITILGPKKLTMNCSSSAIAFAGNSYANSLALKGLTLNATTFADTAGRTFHIPAGNLTVDNCNIEVVSRVGNAVYLGQGNVSDAKGRGNATISCSVFSANSKNTAAQIDGNTVIVDSNVQFSSDTRALYCVGDLTLNGSTLVLTGRSNAVETVNVNGEFTLRTSDAEIIGTRFSIFGVTTLPRTIGEYTVLGGISRDSAATYNEALAGAYQYYYAECLEQPTEPTTPTGIETDPTGTETDPTGSDPTDISTDPTVFHPAEPTDAPTATSGATLPTLPTSTTPVNSTSVKSNVLFWILAALMVLVGCGAAAMAIIMFRRAAEEESEDEKNEDTEQCATEEAEEIVHDEPKKFSLINLKKFFVRNREEDVPEEDICEETQAEIDEKPKKFSWEKLKKFLTKIIDEDIDE